MKKIISLLLALIMTFSVATVAFAEETSAPADTETSAPADTETTEPAEGEGSITDSLDEALGDYKWILDLPFETVGPALKVAKIALKFLKVYWKLCKVFHLDPMETAQGIIEWVTDLAGDYMPEDGETNEGAEGGTPEAAPEETTAPAAA